MSTTDREFNFDAILLDRKTYQLYINAGRMMADKIAEEAGAIRRFGRAVRYYRPAIDAYLEKMNTGELNEVEK